MAAKGALYSFAVYGQDTANRIPAKDTSAATWVTRPWFWIGGLIILIAIYMIYASWAKKRVARRNESGSRVGE